MGLWTFQLLSHPHGSNFSLNLLCCCNVAVLQYKWRSNVMWFCFQERAIEKTTEMESVPALSWQIQSPYGSIPLPRFSTAASSGFASPIATPAAATSQLHCPNSAILHHHYPSPITNPETPPISPTVAESFNLSTIGNHFSFVNKMFRRGKAKKQHFLWLNSRVGPKTIFKIQDSQ